MASRRDRQQLRRTLAAILAGALGCAALAGARWAWRTLPPWGPAFPADCPRFVEGDPWNQDISALPVHPDSETWVRAMGEGALSPGFGPTQGVPLAGIGPGQGAVEVDFVYGDNSDAGPYRVPLDAAVQVGERTGDWSPYPDGDRRVIAVDARACEVFELFGARAEAGGWSAISGSHYSLRGASPPPMGWVSTPTGEARADGVPIEVHDPSGMPLFPGLLDYEELETGAVEHALRVTAPALQRAYIPPARYAASTLTDPALPPVGLRLRMKASYDCAGASAPIQVLCRTLKHHGLILAGQGPSWQLSGVPDPRWSPALLDGIRALPSTAFEAVETGEVVPY